MDCSFYTTYGAKPKVFKTWLHARHHLVLGGRLRRSCWDRSNYIYMDNQVILDQDNNAVKIKFAGSWLEWRDFKSTSKIKVNMALSSNLDLVVSDFRKAYSNIVFKVSKVETGFKVVCTLENIICKEYFFLEYTEEIIRRRMAELVNYALQVAESRP